MTTRDGGSGSQTVTWDDAGRLTSISGSTGGNSGFVYDADGNLLLQKDPGRTTLYLPGEQLVLDTATQTVTGTRYYPLPGGGTAVRTGSGTSYGFEFADQHGTALLRLDSTAQNPTWRQFTPYGGVRGTAPSWWDNRAFLDKPANPTTGLTEIGARQYDAGTGRFISNDPEIDFKDPQSLAGYLYANNNPLTYSDPSGRSWGTFWKVAAIVAVVVVVVAVAVVAGPALVAAAPALMSCASAFAEGAAAAAAMGAGTGAAATAGTLAAAGEAAAIGGAALAEGAGALATTGAAVAFGGKVISSIVRASPDEPMVARPYAGPRYSRAQAQADAAGDDMADKIKDRKTESGQNIAVGAYNRRTGSVYAGCNSNPDFCAERDVERQAWRRGERSSDLQFSQPTKVRPDGSTRDQDVCPYCQADFSKSQYPPTTKGYRNGPWYAI
jgi:RHS repeat-associated protein